jgi:5-methylcytosine-specific restriction endonuclease McrA
MKHSTPLVHRSVGMVDKLRLLYGISTITCVKRYNVTDTQLAQAVKVSTSYMGVLRELGIPFAGGSHSHYTRRTKAAQIDTSHFTGQAHNRGMPSPNRKDPLRVLKYDCKGRVRTKDLRRALDFLKRKYQCDTCGNIGEWQQSKLTLHIDHIDGNSFNNVADNLRYLCPNCHTITPTYSNRQRK